MLLPNCTAAAVPPNHNDKGYSRFLQNNDVDLVTLEPLLQSRTVKIVSSRFEGLKLVMRHRLVYDAVHEMINKAEIHALAITAIAPSEQA